VADGASIEFNGGSRPGGLRARPMSGCGAKDEADGGSCTIFSLWYVPTRVIMKSSFGIVGLFYRHTTAPPSETTSRGHQQRHDQPQEPTGHVLRQHVHCLSRARRAALTACPSGRRHRHLDRPRQRDDGAFRRLRCRRDMAEEGLGNCLELLRPEPHDSPEAHQPRPGVYQPRYCGVR
jgi:hypothetical protein